MREKNNMTKTNRHLDVLRRFKRGRIAVIGDMMLDVYLWGSVTRISPEAPVPVIGIRKQSCCLGGAANVMRNIALLGAQVYPFGVAGDDETAAAMFRAFDELAIDASGIVRDPARRTTEKRRIIAGGQQLLREDFEDTDPVSEKIRRELVGRIVSLIRNGAVDAVIFEDYAKGVLASWMLEEIVAAAAKKKVFTALDPKPGNLSPVKGIGVIKPNRGEAFAMAKLTDAELPEKNPLRDKRLAAVAATLMREWAPEQLMISLAAQGLALYRSGEKTARVIPTRAREVFDVSGAGDTVTGTYTLALSSGAPPEEAAEIANLAAGVVVGKVGTAPITFNELKAACLNDAEEK